MTAKTLTVARVRRFAGLLRGVNVGGHAVLDMNKLRVVLDGLGLRDVQTVLASGNTLFSAEDDGEDRIAEMIGRACRESLKLETTVMVRALDRITEIVEGNPFGGIKETPETKPYVSFLACDPRATPRLPLRSKHGDVEIVAMDGRDVFSLSRRIDGRLGFPNEFVEKTFGIAATTRGWPTVERLVASLT